MSGYVLFSGCAAEHDRRPVHSAALSVARVLDQHLADSGVLACCGARAYSDPVTPDASHLMTSLLAAVRNGSEVVCLSPSCLQSVAAHLAALAKQNAGAAPSNAIIDYVEFLDRAGDFSSRIRRPLTSLNVALHSICHADHHPRERQPQAEAKKPEQARSKRAVAHAAQAVLEPPAAPAEDMAASGVLLGKIVGWTGATVLADVSGGDDARRPGEGEAAGSHVACLTAAAALGADVVATPCHLCYGDLNRYQRLLPQDSPGRAVIVLHLSQVLGLACEVAPNRIGLGTTAVSGKNVLLRYVV